MKKSKRIAAFLTAALLAMAPCALAGMTAFAADGTEPAVTEPAGETTPSTYTITVNATAAAESAFSGYQIFTGNCSGGKLNDIEWGSAFPDAASRSALLTALKADKVFGEGAANSFYGLTNESSAAAVADVMGAIGDKSDLANELAKVIGSKATTAVTDTQSDANVIGNVPSGYYLVKETSDPSQTNPISLNLLKVVGEDATINAKEDLPTLTKKIDEAGGIAANTASIGDKVPFILTSSVPNMLGYDKYFFVITDQLSDGLAFNDDVTITVGDETLTKGTDFTVTQGTEPTDPTVEIVFKDFYDKFNDDFGDAIIVKYTATVTNAANMTQDGNTNIVQLEYSNNPNEEAKPDSSNKDKPSEDSPTGKTPEQKTVTYVTQIDITKVKPNGEGTAPLAGVEFTLEGYKKTVGISDKKSVV